MKNFFLPATSFQQRNIRIALLLCVFFLFTGACQVTLDTVAAPTPAGLQTTPTRPPESTAEPRAATPPARAGLPGCIPPKAAVSQGTVTRITDGDTIRVKIGSQEYKVRYIGIDTPEDTTQVERFGPEATAKNRELVENQVVTLIKDVSETDRYGRLLRYVFVGDTFVNYELVRQGYAQVATYPPDVACIDDFRAAERQARATDLGLWSEK